MNRILLIEDNEQLQKYIRVLLDITLPKFDGFYYLRLIRKKYNVPVIIISALNEEGEQIRGMRCGLCP